MVCRALITCLSRRKFPLLLLLTLGLALVILVNIHNTPVGYSIGGDAPHKPVILPKEESSRPEVVLSVIQNFPNFAQLTAEEAVKSLHEDIQDFKRHIPRAIPKIIHQIYRNRSIPDPYEPLMRSWANNHPDYQYIFWDDSSGDKFIKNYFSDFYPLYKSYCKDIMRSDALRYFILLKFGGIYVDGDFENFKSVSDLLIGSTCYLVQENQMQTTILYRKELIAQNSFMAIAPGHPFIKFMVSNLASAFPHNDCNLDKVLNATGPLMMERMRKIYDEVCDFDSCKIDILPSRLMMPEYEVVGGKWPFYDRTCGNKTFRNNLPQKFDKVCKELDGHVKNGIPPRSNEAYASHKFLHFGNLGHEYRAQFYVDIAKIVPRVRFPETFL